MGKPHYLPSTAEGGKAGAYANPLQNTIMCTGFWNQPKGTPSPFSLQHRQNATTTFHVRQQHWFFEEKKVAASVCRNYKIAW